MFEEYVAAAMGRMVSQEEAIVRQALDAALPGWTMEDVKTRCQWIRVGGSPVITLHVDGEAVLEMHDIEVGEMRNEGDRFVSNVTQRYRKLGKAATG